MRAVLLIVAATLTTVGGSNATLPYLLPTAVAATPNTVEGSNAHQDLTPAAVTYLSSIGARFDAVMTIEGKVGPSYQHHMAYIFFGSQYVKWDLETDSFYSGPRDISSGFPGGHFSHVDAVMTIEGNVGPSYEHHMAYIFTGNQYIKWDLETDSFYSGPRDISSGFPGVPFSRVDAVMAIEGNVGPSYQHHMAYFFSGGQYIRWNLETDSFSEGPRDISSGFHGVHFSHVDAVMTIEGNVGPSYQHHMAYFFSGSQYIRWNLETDSFSEGPRDISSGFPGVPFSRVDAVMTIEGNVGPSYQHHMAYIFFGSQYIKWDLETDSFYSGPRDISSGFPGIPAAIEFPEATTNGSIGMVLVGSVTGALVILVAMKFQKRDPAMHQPELLG